MMYTLSLAKAVASIRFAAWLSTLPTPKATKH